MTTPELPDLSVTIDDIPVDALEEAHHASLGGYDTAQVTLLEEDARKLNVGQGAKLTVYTQDATVRFQGELIAGPHYRDGLAFLKANGFREWADKANLNLCYQLRGPQWFEESGGEPHGYAVDEDTINVEIRRGSVKLWAPPGQAIVTNDTNGCEAWVPGSPGNLIRMAGTLAGDVNANNGFQILRSTGPNGGRSVDGANITATGSFDRVLAAAVDQVGFRFIRLGVNATVGATQLRQILTNIRVNGRADNRNADYDIFYASDVHDDIAALMGYDDSGIAAMLTNILPLYWRDGSAGDLLNYIDILVDGWHRILDKRNGGEPYHEANTWDHSKVWILRQSDGAMLDTPPLAQYNECVVHYHDVTGRPRQTAPATASVPALDDRGRTNTYRIELTEPQPNATFANAVAAAVIAAVSQERNEGKIEFTAAYDEANRFDPFGPLPGDIARVPDYDLGTSRDFHITGTSYNPLGGVVSVGGDFPPTQRLISIHELIKARKLQTYKKLPRAREYRGRTGKLFRRYLEGNWSTKIKGGFGIYNMFRRHQGKRPVSHKRYRRQFG